MLPDRESSHFCQRVNYNLLQWNSLKKLIYTNFITLFQNSIYRREKWTKWKRSQPISRLPLFFLIKKTILQKRSGTKSIALSESDDLQTLKRLPSWGSLNRGGSLLAHKRRFMVHCAWLATQARVRSGLRASSPEEVQTLLKSANQI